MKDNEVSGEAGGAGLKAEWTRFASVMLSPVVLILVVTTVLLVTLSLNPSEETRSNPLLLGFITLVISVLSGTLGALIEKRWSRLNETGILVTRGKSAIRGLKLLLLNIASIERRVSHHLAVINTTTGADGKLACSALEEIVERCSTLEEEAMNAIEEWQDIIPEANLKTEIGFITDLKQDIARYASERSQLVTQLNDAKQESVDARTGLQAQLSAVTAKLEAARKELRDRNTQIDSSVLSGLGRWTGVSSLTPTAHLTDIARRPCSTCGASTILSIGGKCMNCGAPINGGPA